MLVPVALGWMTLTMPHGREEAGPVGLRTTARLLADRWLSWLPALALMALYLAVYRMLGYGALDSGMYVDPLSAPVRFVQHAAQQLPILWLATLSPAPPSLVMFLPGSASVLAVGGVALGIVLGAALWPLRRSRLLLWSAGGYLLLLLPQKSTCNISGRSSENNAIV